MSNNRELADLISQAGGTSEGVLAGRRNLLINGAMQVWQRGTSGFGHNQYSADRWKLLNISNVSRSTDVPAGEGFQYSAKVDIEQGSDNQFYQLIENGIGITDTKTVSLSFWAKTDGTATGFENIYVLNPTNFEILYSSVTPITSSWARYTKTFTLNPTNNNYSDLLMIRFDANPSVGGSYYITGVQLELGSVATPFEHRSYGEELALCQRYFNHVYSPLVASQVDDAQRRITYCHPVQMRVQPTVTVNTDGSGTGSFSASAYSSVDTTQYFVSVSYTNTTLQFINGMYLDAEL